MADNDQQANKRQAQEQRPQRQLENTQPVR